MSPKAKYIFGVVLLVVGILGGLVCGGVVLKSLLTDSPAGLLSLHYLIGFGVFVAVGILGESVFSEARQVLRDQSKKEDCDD